MTGPQIRIEGLAEFNRALGRIDKDAAKRLRLAGNEAAELLISKVRPEIPAKTGKARGSLRARSTRTAARVAVGGKTAPYYPWLDFGGRTGIDRSVERPFYKEGRYLYPTLRRIGSDIAKVLDDGIVAVARDVGLEVD
jgi:hypothetical protein